MRPSLRFLAVWLVTALLISLPPVVLTTTAWAGESPNYKSARVRDALRGEALAAFNRAGALFEVGNYGAARVEYARAHELSADARVAYNMAVCDKELRKYARARTELLSSLVQGGDALPKKHVQLVKVTLGTLEPYVTTLSIEVDEPGADILVDGESVGLSPLGQPVAVDVGEREITARKQGFLATPVRVTARNGAVASARVQMEPLVREGHVTVRVVGPSSQSSTEVLVDGVVVGTAPWSGQVGAGRHVFAVKAQGWAAQPRSQDLASRASLDLVFNMAKRQPMGRLQVSTDNEANTIQLDGQVVGIGHYDRPVAAGTHKLRVTRSGAEPFTADLVLQESETRSLTASLKEKSGIPVWVWIAGGVAIAGATTAVLLLNQTDPKYDGQSPGTLPPRVVPASLPIRGF